MLNKILTLKKIIKSYKDKKEEAEFSQLIIDYQQTFGTEAGQRVLADIVEHCGVLFCNPEQSQIQFREGVRSVGLRILSLIETDPSELEGQSKE